MSAGVGPQDVPAARVRDQALMTDPNAHADRSAPDEDAGEHPPIELRLVVVEYADQTDRGTVLPRTIDRGELTTTWLTADRDDFVDLSCTL